MGEVWKIWIALAGHERVLAGRYPEGEVHFEFDSTNHTVLALDDFAGGRLVEDGLDGRAIGP